MEYRVEDDSSAEVRISEGPAGAEGVSVMDGVSEAAAHDVCAGQRHSS